jgi:hypothetical protein
VYDSSNVSISSGTGIVGLSSYIVSDTSDSVRNPAYINFLSPLLTATTYTFSCFIKKDITADNLNPLIRVRDTDDNYFGTFFNEASGTSSINASGPNATNTWITNVSTTDLTTCFKHQFSFIAQTTAQPYQLQIYGAHGNSATLSGSIEVAGLQVEQGVYSTSYIPTSGLSAVRVADDARVTPISSFFNQQEGTMFMETQYSSIQRFNSSSTPGLWTLDTGAFAQGYGLVYGSSPILIFYTRNLGSNITTINASPNTTSNITKTIVTLSPLRGRTLVYDSRFVGTSDTEYNLPPITIFRIGANYIAGNPPLNFFDGYIRKISYYPTRLSINRLRTLTQ